MSFTYARKVAKMAMGTTAMIAQVPEAPPAPEITNGGNGESLIIAWPDTLTIPPGGTVRVAYRESDQLYWEDILETTDPPPLTITGLTEGIEYAVSLSIPNDDDMPSLFGDETAETPVSAPPPENFETTSTPSGVDMQWRPRPEPNTLEYIIERAIPGGDFEEIQVLSHPESLWTDASGEEGQLSLYRIKPRNDQLVVGDPSAVQEGQLASHHLDILVIDATPDGSGGSSAPIDEEVDDFYEDLLMAFYVDDWWDRADSMAADVTISDADLAPYVLVLVYTDYYTASIEEDTTAFRKYIQNEGRLLIGGWRLSYSIGGRMGYDNGFHAGDFLYDICGIDSIQVVAPPMVELVGVQGVSLPNLVFDAERFPYWGGGLIFSEAIWNEDFYGQAYLRGTFEAASGAASPFHGKPLVLRESVHEPPHWMLIDAPLYYMTEGSAWTFLYNALSEMEAPGVGVEQETKAGIPAQFHLDTPHPNPFNSQAIISFDLPVAEYVTLEIFDIHGRNLRAVREPPLHNQVYPRGHHQLTFDASELPSGIYFVRLEAGDYRAAKKMVLLK
jgi:hypothetical protein